MTFMYDFCNLFIFIFFFFNDTATTEIYTLSLHDALPIYLREVGHDVAALDVLADAHDHRVLRLAGVLRAQDVPQGDRKSTRLNSSHANISYAVFCLKKKKKIK